MTSLLFLDMTSKWYLIGTSMVPQMVPLIPQMVPQIWYHRIRWLVDGKMSRIGCYESIWYQRLSDTLKWYPIYQMVPLVPQMVPYPWYDPKWYQNGTKWAYALHIHIQTGRGWRWPKIILTIFSPYQSEYEYEVRTPFSPFRKNILGPNMVDFPPDLLRFVV